MPETIITHTRISQLTERERISQYVRDLKISTIRDNLEDAVSTAMEEHWTYQRFLAELLQKEVDTRIENRKIQRSQARNDGERCRGRPGMTR